MSDPIWSRRPVSSVLFAGDILVVICDDGSVYASGLFLADGDARAIAAGPWVQLATVPGTPAAS